MEAEERPLLEHDAIAALAVEFGYAMKGHAGLFITPWPAVDYRGLHIILVHYRLPFHLQEGSARLGNGLAGSVWEMVVSRKEGGGAGASAKRIVMNALQPHTSARIGCEEEEEVNNYTTTIACRLDFTSNAPLERQAEPPLVAFGLASPSS